MLPEGIWQLAQLQTLDISGNQLTALPEAFGQLAHLKMLSLDGNQLTALPEAFGQLAQLRTLSLTDNQLTALPEAFGQLAQLRTLSLTDNQLTALPEAFGQLAQLQMLSLTGNQLTALPKAIGRLAQLQTLDLARNRLTTLPEALGQLTRLQHLNLDGNRLAVLPEALRRMAGLETLYLHDNPALGLPAELLGPTWQEDGEPANPADILDFYFRSRGDSRPLNEAKLILVGFGDVGKTSLVNRLVHDTFTAGEAKTEGIAITQWPIRLNGTEDVRLHVWDFGGQEIMHATHRFFLSQRTLYLVVLNGRGGRQQADAAYWLNLIATYAPDSPVIIVRNKIREDPCPLDRTALRRDFPAIRAEIDTDCADRTGIDALAAAIRRETDALPELRSRFPAAWFDIKDRLSAMTENYLSLADYRALCAGNGEADPAAQESLAFVLHCLGTALNYRDDPRLRDTNVLNPHWVTEGVYGILNHQALTTEAGRVAGGRLARPARSHALPARAARLPAAIDAPLRTRGAVPRAARFVSGAGAS
jgi:internalin A